MRTKDLIDIHRREKVSPYLQDLGDNFYSEVKELIQRKYNLYYELKDDDVSKVSVILQELENIKSLAQDLYETRERKIVTNALYFVKSGEEIEYDNMTPEEVELMRQIINILKDSREKVLNFIFEKEDTKSYSDSTEERDKSVYEELSYITVRILGDLPAIVGIDGKIYGDFKAEDIVTLPEPNARALINRGEAQEVKL